MLGPGMVELGGSRLGSIVSRVLNSDWVVALGLFKL